MKKILTFLFVALITSSSYSQSNKEDVDLIQAMYGKAKKEVVADYMKMDKSKETAFWSVYDTFENERKTLGRSRINIISDYAQHYEKLDDVKAGNLAKNLLDNNVALEKLNQKYFPKFSAAVGARNAAKYMQLELYLQTAVRSAMQEEIPFIDELEKSKKDIN